MVGLTRALLFTISPFALHSLIAQACERACGPRKRVDDVRIVAVHCRPRRELELAAFSLMMQRHAVLRSLLEELDEDLTIDATCRGGWHLLQQGLPCALIARDTEGWWSFARGLTSMSCIVLFLLAFEEGRLSTLLLSWLRSRGGSLSAIPPRKSAAFFLQYHVTAIRGASVAVRIRQRCASAREDRVEKRLCWLV